MANARSILKQIRDLYHALDETNYQQTVQEILALIRRLPEDSITGQKAQEIMEGMVMVGMGIRNRREAGLPEYKPPVD